MVSAVDPFWIWLYVHADPCVEAATELAGGWRRQDYSALEGHRCVPQLHPWDVEERQSTATRCSGLEC